MCGRDDVLVAEREAVKLPVKELLEAFGFAWKAGQVFERQGQATSSWGEAGKNRGGGK
jgi:hypothetical protein